MLYLLGRLGAQAMRDKSLEISGPATERLSVSSRMTVANLAAALGARFALFAADEVALAHIERNTGARVLPFGPDREARYESTHRLDLSTIEPQVACLRGPSEVNPASQMSEVAVQQAFVGSCANGRFEDLQIAAAVLRGRRVHPDTRLIVTPASRRVMLRAVKAGLVEALLEAGAVVTSPGCGPCAGEHQGLLAPGECCISSSSRAFRGCMGSADAAVYLASPATVAASAIAGRIADPREYWQPEAA
jgi:homoaconitase/3-isopropylmalate dehydratase large subunit